MQKPSSQHFCSEILNSLTSSRVPKTNPAKCTTNETAGSKRTKLNKSTKQAPTKGACTKPTHNNQPLKNQNRMQIRNPKQILLQSNQTTPNEQTPNLKSGNVAKQPTTTTTTNKHSIRLSKIEIKLATKSTSHLHKPN